MLSVPKTPIRRTKNKKVTAFLKYSLLLPKNKTEYDSELHYLER
jgi:hypothetical protein